LLHHMKGMKMSVHKKLMEARIRLQNTKLEKTGHNKFAGYSYFELGDFLPAVQKIFAEIGLCGVISYGNNDDDLASLQITDTEDMTSLCIYSPMAEANLKGCHPIQNLGAAQTYLRRYLWVTAMEIVEHDVLDATTGQDSKIVKSVPASVWDTMPEAKQRELQGIVDSVRACMEADKMDDALGTLHEVTDADEKIALWSRLDSKERAAIKKAQGEKK